jgi:hypothetical protein
MLVGVGLDSDAGEPALSTAVVGEGVPLQRPDRLMFGRRTGWGESGYPVTFVSCGVEEDLCSR